MERKRTGSNVLLVAPVAKMSTDNLI